MSLDEELIQLEKELSNCKQRIEEIKIAIAKRDYGVEPGVIVSVRGDLYKVAEVSTYLDCNGKLWLSGNPKKKDGTFSKKVHNLYGDWELLAQEKAA